MANRFLNTGGGDGNSNVSNGTTVLYGSTLGALSFEPAMPVKTTNEGELITALLDIDDINILQSELDDKMPLNGSINVPLNLNGNHIVNVAEAGGSGEVVVYEQLEGLRTYVEDTVYAEAVSAKSTAESAAQAAATASSDAATVLGIADGAAQTAAEALPKTGGVVTGDVSFNAVVDLVDSTRTVGHFQGLTSDSLRAARGSTSVSMKNGTQIRIKTTEDILAGQVVSFADLASSDEIRCCLCKPGTESDPSTQALGVALSNTNANEYLFVCTSGITSCLVGAPFSPNGGAALQVMNDGKVFQTSISSHTAKIGINLSAGSSLSVDDFVLVFVCKSYENY